METFISAKAFVDGLEGKKCLDELRALRNAVGMNGNSFRQKDDSRELALRLCRIFSHAKGIMEMSTWRL